MSKFYTVFVSNDQEKITDCKVSEDIHVYKGENDIFHMLSGEEFKIDFEKAYLQKVKGVSSEKIIKTWIDDDEQVRYVILENPLPAEPALGTEALMGRYAKFKNKVWEEMKGNKEFVEYRKALVDALLKESIEEFECGNECKFVSVGSVTKFSDYDVNVTGPYATEIVERFNERFRELFQQESAVVFDTNVYGSSFVNEVHENNFCEYQMEKDGHRRRFYYAYAEDSRNVVKQRQWALIKLFNYLNDDEKNVMAYAYKMVKPLLEELQARTKGKNDTKILNVLYVKMLKEHNYYRKKMLAHKIEDEELRNNLKYHYKDSLSRANYFGNDMYYTQGAFIHVVMNIQSKLSFPLNKNDYMDSFIENLGGCFKVLGEYEKIESKLCQKVIESVSKYLSRALDALLKGGFLKNANLYEITETIRTQVRGQEKKMVCSLEERESCVNVEFAESLNRKFLESLGIEHCRELRRFFMHIADEYIKLVNLGVL